MMNSSRFVASIAVFALILATLPVDANAADAPVLSNIIKTKTLRVGMSLQQPPLNVKAEDGEMMGLEVDLARLLASAFGVELRIVEKPFAELLPALKSGELDMVMSGMGITPERALEVAFAGPYLLSGKSLVTKSEELAEIMDPTDLEELELTIAVLGGSTSESFVKRYAPGAKVVAVKDYDAAVAMVRKDEADAMVADMPICMLAALRYEDDGLKTLSQPLTIEPVAVAISDADPKFRDLVQAYITVAQDNGIIDLLKERWFGDSSWVNSLP
jgi:polar amino acid transport system substrate-binding protein